MEDNKVSYEAEQCGKRLGKAPAKSHPLMLNASSYLGDVAVPKKLDYWKKRKPFPIRDYGNNQYGNCTRASQAILAIKMELQERRRMIDITTDEIVRVYTEMSDRLYGGGDNGAYEIDALGCWRNPEYTFRDTKGNPLTIDAYTRINQSNIDQVKKAIFLAGAKAVKVCFALPQAWSDTLTWDIPEGQAPIGKYLPSSWGGHSMVAAEGYDENWLYLDHTWNCPMGKISWRAFAIFADEAYMIIDSVNSWKKRLTNKEFKGSKLISDVNNVSDFKIK